MQGKFGGPRSVRRPCLGPTLPLQTVGKSFRDDCNPSEAESCSRTAMPEDSPEFQEHIVTQVVYPEHVTVSPSLFDIEA